MPGAGGARSAFAAGRTGFGGCFGFRFHGTKAYHSGPRERDATAGLAPRFNRKKRLRYSCHQVLYPKLKKVYCSCSKRCIITAALMKETLQRVSAKIRILFFGGGRIFHLCRNAFRGGEHSPPDFFLLAPRNDTLHPIRQHTALKMAENSGFSLRRGFPKREARGTPGPIR